MTTCRQLPTGPSISDLKEAKDEKEKRLEQKQKKKKKNFFQKTLV
jgi:hypothetical protein